MIVRIAGTLAMNVRFDVGSKINPLNREKDTILRSNKNLNNVTVPYLPLLTPVDHRHSGGVCVQWVFFRRSVYLSQNPFLVFASAESNRRRHASEQK
jgi:hypothetical protein